jgi:hypothetical protein
MVEARLAGSKTEIGIGPETIKWTVERVWRHRSDLIAACESCPKFVSIVRSGLSGIGPTISNVPSEGRSKTCAFAPEALSSAASANAQNNLRMPIPRIKGAFHLPAAVESVELGT